MQQIKIFKTNNKDIVNIQNKINCWIEDEELKVDSITTSTGASYKNNSDSNFDEIEIFIIILYEKQ